MSAPPGIFALPPGYRPEFDESVANTSEQHPTRPVIHGSGTVEPSTAQGTVDNIHNISLDGVSFRCALGQQRVSVSHTRFGLSKASRERLRREPCPSEPGPR